MTSTDEDQSLRIRARWPGPVCGYLVFDDPPRTYQICSVCGWEDDGVQVRHPRMRERWQHIRLSAGSRDVGAVARIDPGRRLAGTNPDGSLVVFRRTGRSRLRPELLRSARPLLLVDGLVVSIRPFTWRLPGPCRVCGQGDCLLLCVCPKCAALVVICEEDETTFPDLRNLQAALRADSCPSCRTVMLHDFVAADWKRAQAAGFKPGEYV